MNTTFAEVDGWFLNKIKSYELLMFTDVDKNEILHGYMRFACAEFTCCDVDLSDRNDDDGEFNNELSDEILNIISEGMVIAWLKPKLNNEENLYNALSTQDYKYYSPANLLEKISNTYEMANKRFKKMKSNYSFNHGKLPKRGV